MNNDSEVHKTPTAVSDTDGQADRDKRQIQRIAPRIADVGGIPVARVLPYRQRRLVGAWCFLDHAGPAVFEQGNRGMRVGPHPHIGLQTFTWMIEGEILHRDSLGNLQVIRPGQVNLMTAGYGISHTEETVEGERHLHATQLWIALPKAHRNTAPRFDHYPDLPRWREQGAELTLLVGEFMDCKAPTLTFSPLVGVDIAASEAAHLRLPLRQDFEYALLALEGGLEINGESFACDELAYLGSGQSEIETSLPAGSRAILIGGAPLGEDITIWWNYVGHSRDEIVEAHRDWEQGGERFGSVPGYEGEPLQAPPLPWG